MVFSICHGIIEELKSEKFFTKYFEGKERQVTDAKVP
jgi:hypothetical protein